MVNKKYAITDYRLVDLIACLSFDYRVAWKVHCQGNTDAYTEGCFVDENKVETKQSSQPTTVTDNKRPDWLSHFIALTDLLPFVSK